MKQCSKCKEAKPLSEFHAYKRNKTDGKRAQCKPCRKAAAKKYYDTGGSEVMRQHHLINRDERLAKMKEYRENNKEYFAEYGKAYREANRETLRAKATKRARERYRTDIPFRLKTIVGRAVRGMLNGREKSSATFDALPYTPEQLKEHLEKQFQPGMSWDNYGSEWDIDHIYPQSLLPYDSFDHPNFQRCWSLDNLQPLDKIANIKKSNKIL